MIKEMNKEDYNKMSGDERIELVPIAGSENANMIALPRDAPANVVVAVLSVSGALDYVFNVFSEIIK